jgi:hypothetical protein
LMKSGPAGGVWLEKGREWEFSDHAELTIRQRVNPSVMTVADPIRRFYAAELGVLGWHRDIPVPE